jgi:hypothetical protein
LRAAAYAHILQASDLASTSRVIIAIVTIAKNAQDWNLMNEQVLLLSKKHGQLKQAITKMVQIVMGFLDETPNLETKLSVIETLRTVTEGKVGGANTSITVRLLTCPDLRRSRASPHNPHTVRHQEGARRHQGSDRHPLRASSRDVWIHDPPRED